VQDIRAALRSGELTFEKAAEKFSDSPERARGGDLGWARLGTYQFDGEAFKLQTGELSPVFRTFLGYHILQVTERRNVKIDNPDRLKRVITQNLYKKRFNVALDAWKRSLQSIVPTRTLPLTKLGETTK
jgi:parvulin-like peptidyl-prolyl isomerase